MSTQTVEFLTKEKAERLAARVKAFESKGREWKSLSQRSPISGSLDEYQGEWTPRLARHLLSRCLWGATRGQVETAASMSLEDVVDMLLQDQPMPDPPVNYFNEEDPFAQATTTSS